MSATGLPGQEKGPCADIDILVSSSQAAAVLLKVVPGILVEVWHLVGESRLRSTPGLSIRDAPSPKVEGQRLKEGVTP